jgi:hypothetical protein
MSGLGFPWTLHCWQVHGQQTVSKATDMLQSTWRSWENNCNFSTMIFWTCASLTLSGDKANAQLATQVWLLTHLCGVLWMERVATYHRWYWHWQGLLLLTHIKFIEEL